MKLKDKKMEKIRYERPVVSRVSIGIPDKVGMKKQNEAITHIDNVSVSDLIEEFGSPQYVISEKTIRETYKDVKQAFTSRYPKVQFAWSYKTNYLDAVCNVFHQEGSWAEVVSGFEYDKAISNGVKGNHIIFNGPDKSENDLRLAIKNGSLIHIDHFDELHMIIELSKEMEEIPKVAIRVNMDTGIYPMWDRFGFNYENGEAWEALNQIMQNDKLELIGLHTHIGTYIMAPSGYYVAATKLANLASRINQKYNHTIKYIDMGGGFASKNTLKGAYLPGSDTCPSFNDYAEAITSGLLNSELRQENMPMLILESGRALIDEAGYLIGTVLANKKLSDGRRSTIVDIGINLLFTSFWYEHNIVPGQIVTGYNEHTSIYGPLCMNIDIIRENILFPILKKGEHVVINRIGAYNMTQWLQFITLRPNIVMIGLDGKPRVIRESETNNSLTQHEHVPDYLTKFDV